MENLHKVQISNLKFITVHLKSFLFWLLFKNMPYFQVFYVSHRHILAATHFNRNLKRELRTSIVTGLPQVKIVYPKFKKGIATVRDVRVKQNFDKYRYILLFLEKQI